MLAYDEWKALLAHTFPNLYQHGWGAIYDGLANVDVGWAIEESMMKMRIPRDISEGKGIVHKMGAILTRNKRDK